MCTDSFRIAARRRLRLHSRGFTISELLVAIALMAVLLVLLLSGFGAARNASRLAGCQANLRQIGIGFQQYANDNQDRCPPHWGMGFNGVVLTWYGHIAPYITDWKGNPTAGMSKLFHCPSNPRPHNPRQTYLSLATNMDQSYGYNYQFLSSNAQWKGIRRINIVNSQKLVLIADIPTYGDRNDIVPFPSSVPWLRLYPAMAPDGVSGLNAISRRHTGGVNVLYLDGRVERQNSLELVGGRFQTENWKPVEQ